MVTRSSGKYKSQILRIIRLDTVRFEKNEVLTFACEEKRMRDLAPAAL